MSCSSSILFGICAGWLAWVTSGCAPTVATHVDKQQGQRLFMIGENCINARDYPGAVQAFKESLEENPGSAVAHFELGRLYDQILPNPAAAIYHYERYLQLDPDAGNVDVVKERIKICKQALAGNVLALPGTFAQRQRIEQLMAQNRQLEDKIHVLQTDLKRWNTYCINLLTARAHSSDVSAPDNFPFFIPGTDRLATPACLLPDGWRTHTVVAGDTVDHIARHYGLSLKALLAANPGLKPRRMKVGQVLNIPPN